MEVSEEIKEKNKKLIERYPYLQPRNVWTDKIPDDYDYSYIRGDGELPEGWIKLFMQMCEDIRQPLIDANYLDEFRFTQVKEKYNTMRVYTCGVPKDVSGIIYKYEYVSQFICTRCGKPAFYVTTDGYIESFCVDCAKKMPVGILNDTEKIKFEPIMKVHQFSKDGDRTIEYDCSDIWERLYKDE